MSTGEETAQVRATAEEELDKIAREAAWDCVCYQGFKATDDATTRIKRAINAALLALKREIEELAEKLRMREFLLGTWEKNYNELRSEKQSLQQRLEKAEAATRQGSEIE